MVEGDVVAAPQHRALPRAPVLAAEPVPALTRAVGTGGDTGLTGQGTPQPLLLPACQALAPHPKTQDMMDIRPICRLQPWWAQGPQPSGAGSGPRTLASLTTGCSAGGWSGPGRSAGDGGGRGRRLGGHRAPHPHRAPAHTRSRRRSPGGTARPRRCPRPRSWRGRRTRSPRTAAPRRTPALPGQMPRSAPVGSAPMGTAPTEGCGHRPLGCT